jgi:6-phosphogluconolactonase
MSPRTLILSLAALTTTALAGDKYLVYYGTYTGAKTGSKGIYVSTFDSSTGTLGKPELAGETGSPSFVAIHPSKKYLYSVGEMSIPGQKGGGVTAFSIALPSGALTQINQVSSVTAGPCHVNLDKTGTMAMIANYGGGSTASYQIQSDGSLSQPTSHHQHIGSSVDPKRQKEPHAHSVNISPDNRFAFVCDLGTDKVNIYAIDPSTGKMTPHEPAFGKVPAGSGPRHLAFHPSGKFVFVNNEMSMTETVFAYDTAKGTLTEIQTVSTIPEADRSQPGLSTAETVAHPNGKIVYVSNRGHDTISVFHCDPATGKLTLIQNASVEGKTPRNFNLDPTGKWLIAAHQGSNSIALFKVDPDTGKLTFTGTKHEVGGPCCVRFLEL